MLAALSKFGTSLDPVTTRTASEALATEAPSVFVEEFSQGSSENIADLAPWHAL